MATTTTSKGGNNNTGGMNGVPYNFVAAPTATYDPVDLQGDFGQAILNAPNDYAEGQEKLAQAQAGTATAQAQVQQMQTQRQAAQLAQLLPVLQQRPDLAFTPAVRGILEPILQARGIPYPTQDTPGASPAPGAAVPGVGGAAGAAPAQPTATQLDAALGPIAPGAPAAMSGMGGVGAAPAAGANPNGVQGLLAMLVPQKTFASMEAEDPAATQQFVNEQMMVPPEQRVLPPDAPAWLRTARARVPLSATGISQVFNSLSAKEKLLSDSKSGYTPAQFFADVKATQARLRASGSDGDADTLNEYLSPDGTTLNDAFRQRHVGEAYDLEKQKLDQLGIHLTNEDTYKKQREADLNAQFAGMMQFRYSNLSREEKRDAVQAQAAQSRADEARQALTARLTAIDLMQQRFELSQSTHDFAIYKGVVNQASSQLDNLQKHYDDVTSKITAIANSSDSKLKNSDIYKKLLEDQIETQQTLQTQRPILQARMADAAGSMARTYTSISGNPASSPGGVPPTTDGSASGGEQTRVNPANGKTYYLHADGNYYPTP